MSKKSKNPAALAGANRVQQTEAPSKELVIGYNTSLEGETPAVQFLMSRFGLTRYTARVVSDHQNYGADT